MNDFIFMFYLLPAHSWWLILHLELILWTWIKSSILTMINNMNQTFPPTIWFRPLATLPSTFPTMEEDKQLLCWRRIWFHVRRIFVTFILITYTILFNFQPSSIFIKKYYSNSLQFKTVTISKKKKRRVFSKKKMRWTPINLPLSQLNAVDPTSWLTLKI